MNIYPAIDLFEGKVVRLARGDYAQQTVYSAEPEKTAQEWERQGAGWLHIVDLEGAKDGTPKNLETIKRIRGSVQTKIQLGGGVRSVQDIQQAIEAGVDRVVIGTKAMDESFLRLVLGEFGDKIAVGLDVRNDRVKTQGWINEGGMSLLGAIQYFNNHSVGTIIYTDIQKDGMLEGPNFMNLEIILSECPNSQIILSGGVATLEDIQKCAYIENKNFEGVITGKAIYENIFSVSDAVEIAKSKK